MARIDPMKNMSLNCESRPKEQSVIASTPFWFSNVLAITDIVMYFVELRLLSVWLRWTSLTADHTRIQYWWVIRDTRYALHKKKGRTDQWDHPSPCWTDFRCPAGGFVALPLAIVSAKRCVFDRPVTFPPPSQHQLAFFHPSDPSLGGVKSKYPFKGQWLKSL